jgi:hypothetical protein
LDQWPREETLAESVVTTTRQRTKGQVGLAYVSDGWEPYVTTIKTIYREHELSGDSARLGYLAANRWDPPDSSGEAPQRTRPGASRGACNMGEPVEQPYAVHMERLTGTLRDRLGCLTRNTHAFAKDVATWNALLSLTLFEHNWIRPHLALRRLLAEPHDGRRYERRTPAMALGLTDHPWSWEEFLR